MSRLSLLARGPLPADEVWERYAVPSRWPSWAPYLHGVEGVEGRLAPGARGRVHGPLGVRADFVVDAVDEAARTWSWTVRAGPVGLRLEHGVRPYRSGSQAWLVLYGPGPLLCAYAPFARWALRRLTR